MTNAGHRLLWTIIALLLVAGGATVLAAGLGTLPGTDPAAVLLSPALVDRWRTTTPCSTLAAAVAGTLVALAGQ
ncbi:hypothetical protein, partial [Micromonospora tarensis]